MRPFFERFHFFSRALFVPLVNEIQFIFKFRIKIGFFNDRLAIFKLVKYWL